MDDHNKAVATIAGQVKKFHSRQQPFRIYHGSTNSTRQSQHDHNNTINTAHLNHVIRTDCEAQTVLVEPNVPMDHLVQATLAAGLVPLVVMEFPGITVGGGFSGTSGESSSFRHGFFDATVNWIEIVLPNGEVRIASKNTDPDLFWGAASAFGTLGVVTLLEVQCQQAKPYVELKYQSSSCMAQAMDIFRTAAADPQIDYLDGIVFARDQIVVCTGRLTDALPANVKPQRFTGARDPWFYLHAQKRANSCSRKPDYIPLTDYLFRYDRGGFWVARYAYSYFLVPFNRITRYILDYFMHTRVMYHALHESGHSKRYIIQDVAVPYAATTEFLDWLDQKQNFGAYPIWLCPLRQSEGLMSRTDSNCAALPSTSVEDDGYLMNFGLWAPSPFHSNTAEFIAQNRRLEGKVRELGGKKWLYAHAYYTEDEFWSLYDKRKYDQLRERYHASYLPDLYQKVRVRLAPEDGKGQVGWGSIRDIVWNLWPVSGLYGVYKAWRGGDYLLKAKQKGKTASH
ncbi:delta(24)-sterol reductase [Aspergillus udagawae]|nr:delta(24)-sterol reductase [Aspergillus udagawae]GFG24059.1 delta(24)-sterol reductase [Aspergillus udagawae]